MQHCVYSWCCVPPGVRYGGSEGLECPGSADCGLAPLKALPAGTEGRLPPCCRAAMTVVAAHGRTMMRPFMAALRSMWEEGVGSTSSVPTMACARSRASKVPPRTSSQ